MLLMNGDGMDDGDTWNTKAMEDKGWLMMEKEE